MADPILPTVSQLVTAAIDAVVAAYPQSLPYFNSGGRWATLPKLWAAQATVLLERLRSEVLAARIDFAGQVSSDSLRALCASEFNTILPSAPQTALGAVTLERPQPADANGNILVAPSGTIPAGTRFTRAANPLAIPLPIAGASFTSTATIYVPEVPVNGPFDGLTATVPITATTPGTAGNVPVFPAYGNDTTIAPAQALFDSTFTTLAGATGGGSSGLTNPVLIAAAKAYVVGQYGPTMGALVAGLLAQQSVRHYAIFPGTTGISYAQAFFADESWSTSAEWESQIAQALNDTWIGFGCRVRTGTIINQQIVVSPTVTLLSTDDLNDTTDIQAAITQVVESYFNDRPDWYRFRLESLRQTISKADSRIQQCTGVTVVDALSGSAVPEPSNTFGQAEVFFGETFFNPLLVHYYVTDSNVQPSFLPPT